MKSKINRKLENAIAWLSLRMVSFFIAIQEFGSCIWKFKNSSENTEDQILKKQQMAEKIHKEVNLSVSEYNQRVRKMNSEFQNILKTKYREN